MREEADSISNSVFDRFPVLLPYVAACLLSLAGSAAHGEEHIVGPFNDRYYELFHAARSVEWDEAQQLAADRRFNGLPGYLATITTLEEHAFLLSELPELQVENVWIGANDRSFENFFQWATGESAGYGIGIAGMFEAWAAGEPNGEDLENCLVSSGAASGWTDQRCDSAIDYFLVEYSAPIIDFHYCHSRSGVSPVPDPGAFAIIPEMGIDPDCEGQSPQAPLFTNFLVILDEIPTYLNAYENSDANFNAFVAGASMPGSCVTMTRYLVDSSIGVINYGAGCGSPSADLTGQTIERIELLIGDETRSEYDSQRRSLSYQSDYSLTYYGATTPAREINIDVKPGNSRNVINPRERGGIWVAVLSAPEFDALQIDPASVRSGPDEASPNRHRVRDVNRDGLSDMMLRFQPPMLGISCESMELELRGETYTGGLVIGADAIKTKGCKKSK